MRKRREVEGRLADALVKINTVESQLASQVRLTDQCREEIKDLKQEWWKTVKEECEKEEVRKDGLIKELQEEKERRDEEFKILEEKARTEKKAWQEGYNKKERAESLSREKERLLFKVKQAESGEKRWRDESRSRGRDAAPAPAQSRSVSARTYMRRRDSATTDAGEAGGGVRPRLKAVPNAMSALQAERNAQP